MANKPKKRSDTARSLLTVAATRDDHLIQPPHLPIAAARQVARSLLGSGLAEEVARLVRPQTLGGLFCDGGKSLVLRVTAVGRSYRRRRRHHGRIDRKRGDS